MHRIKLFWKYFVYKLHAKGEKGHGVHSPFLFKLITAVLNDRNYYKEYKIVEHSRSLYNSSKEFICLEDFGAGSRVFNDSKRKLRDIAKKSATRPKYGELLFRLVRFFQPQTIVEFGTSLGIGTLYMALAAPNAKLTTIEGSKELATHSQNLFRSLGLKNILVVTGEFKKVVEEEIINETVDFVYFDGCHTKEMTLNLFEKMASKSSSSAVFVFDDIHWSCEMEDAWKVIKNDKRVTLSLDLFQIGIVFFRTGMAKQHVVLNFKKYC